MNKLKTIETDLNNIINLTEEQAATRYNLGRYSLRPIAENIGAVVHVGRKVFYNRVRLDDYFSNRAE